MSDTKKRIVLVIGGGIAAYKSLDIVRHLMRADFAVDCVMTQGAQQFIQPLSFASLSGNRVRATMFDANEEAEMDHIGLSRQAALILVAPATANIIAKMAQGIADDLATTLLLATSTPIMIAPAMNWRMWAHKATQRNIMQLKQDGVHLIPPDTGEMACGEYGAGRLPDPAIIAQEAVARVDHTTSQAKSLRGKKFLITAGATREAIDPVRYIGNHSSGKQGYAIAERLSRLGAEIILVSGKAEIACPQNMIHVPVESADEMMAACQDYLCREKIDGAICVAAVCDWRIQPTAQKIKKQAGAAPNFIWEQNPDILANIASHKNRPQLVIGFAAETENLLENARKKLAHKKCDWIIANNVAQNIFGSDKNKAVLIRQNDEIDFPEMTKSALAEKLAEHIIHHFAHEAMKI